MIFTVPLARAFFLLVDPGPVTAVLVTGACLVAVCLIEIVRGSYFFGLVFPLATLVRLADRNTTEPRSGLKRHGVVANGLLTAICSAELPIFPINRLAGLSAFVLALKP